MCNLILFPHLLIAIVFDWDFESKRGFTQMVVETLKHLTKDQERQRAVNCWHASIMNEPSQFHLIILLRSRDSWKWILSLFTQTYSLHELMLLYFIVNFVDHSFHCEMFFLIILILFCLSNLHFCSIFALALQSLFVYIPLSLDSVHTEAFYAVVLAHSGRYKLFFTCLKHNSLLHKTD